MNCITASILNLKSHWQQKHYSQNAQNALLVHKQLTYKKCICLKRQIMSLNWMIFLHSKWYSLIAYSYTYASYMLHETWSNPADTKQYCISETKVIKVYFINMQIYCFIFMLKKHIQLLWIKMICSIKLTRTLGIYQILGNYFLVWIK